MNYLITDDEVHALDVLRHQLGFAASIVADAKDEHSISCTPSELYFFVNAQHKAVAGVLEAVYARHAAAAEGAGMNAALWVSALRIASGDKQYTPAGTEERITRCLANEVATSPDMRQVLDEWCKVLCRDGQQVSVPDAEPLLDAAQVCEIYGVKNPKGVTQAQAPQRRRKRTQPAKEVSA